MACARRSRVSSRLDVDIVCERPHVRRDGFLRPHHPLFDRPHTKNNMSSHGSANTAPHRQLELERSRWSRRPMSGSPGRNIWDHVSLHGWPVAAMTSGEPLMLVAQSTEGYPPIDPTRYLPWDRNDTCKGLLAVVHNVEASAVSLKWRCPTERTTARELPPDPWISVEAREKEGIILGLSDRLPTELGTRVRRPCDRSMPNSTCLLRMGGYYATPTAMRDSIPVIAQSSAQGSDGLA